MIEVSNANDGNVSIESNGNIEFTPDNNFFGRASFEYVVTDGITEDTGIAEIDVTPINDPPILSGSLSNYTVTPDAPDRRIDLKDVFDDVDREYYISYGGSSLSSLFKPYEFVLDSNNELLVLGYKGFREFFVPITGNYDITITNFDREGETAETTFTVTIVDSDENPNLLEGAEGDDHLSSKLGDDTLIGNAGNDTLFGNEDNDILYGNQDDDILHGNEGNDTLDGGEGSDSFYTVSDSNIVLTNTQVTGDGIDTISNIEFAHLSGGVGDNVIDASSATQIQGILNGGDGNDILGGTPNDDTLEGGSGDDRERKKVGEIA